MNLQHLTVQQFNWILIGIYFLFCMAQLLFSNWGSMDAAGRGMAKGFLMIYFVYVLVLAGLNLINAKWMHVIVLGLCAIPVFLVLSRTLGR
ncbi:MAG: hypothetical protein R3330_12065, partial [Saprospiraceae bacterium]|nr:hypothetical protein [Saprospiraceae bacterium]